jgi:hypothetical protein
MMNMLPNKDFLHCIADDGVADIAVRLRDGLSDGSFAVFLGPGLLALSDARDSIPASPEAVAAALHARAPAPSRIRTNMWSVAQHIEQRRHRKTLKAWMAEIFSTEPQPSALHRWLATLHLPLVVDSWYDGTMRKALLDNGRPDIATVQGVTRSGEYRDIWTRTYALDGTPIEEAALSEARTVLYEPHGGARPAGNFLVADSDYVEVLTEIDIQTPIPEVIKDRRAGLGFVFLGCRFDDQMLRTYARQIIKRSKGPHYAVMESAGLSRNERHFLAVYEITLIDVPLSHFAEMLMP